MRYVLLILTLIAFLGVSVTGCSAKMDQKIRESTNLGMDNMIKAKDKGQNAALLANLNSDPVLEYYYRLGYFKGAVSHGVATLTGTLRTQELVDLAVERAKAVQGIKEVINEIEVDPTMEEQPFEW